MNTTTIERVISCPHDNGHENNGEGNICVDCRATTDEIRQAQEIGKVDCPACFGTEDDCNSCDGRGYFLRAKGKANG